MRARGWAIALAMMLSSEVALAEPKPKPIDIKPFRDKLQGFVDGKGGLYFIAWLDDERRVFYGANPKQVYEQRHVRRSTNGAQWSVTVDAPRLPEDRPAYISRKEDGTFSRSCEADEAALTELTGDKLKTAIDKAQFLTTALMWTPVVLARDNTGTYYYADKLVPEYGGKGFRVFVGKRGAMKLTPLADVASDSAGEVFATKNGELRLVHMDGEPSTAEWARGSGEPLKLTVLSSYVNAKLIYNDLGVYSFLGTLCDNI